MTVYKNNKPKEQIIKKINECLILKYGEKINQKKSVLWFEWFTDGREIEQLKLVAVFLRDVLGWEIHYVSQFNPLPTLFKKYDLAITSGIIGHKRGINWAKAIFSISKIPLFISQTEGIYRSNMVEQFVWGNLKNEKKILWTVCNQWSPKANKLLKKEFPQIQSSFAISGSIGIDNYVISSDSKNLYDFGIALNADLMTYETVIVDYGLKYAKIWLNEYQAAANREIIYFIKKFSKRGFSFLIKSHPLLGSKKHYVEKQIKDLKNVTVVDINSSIEEAIRSCSVWITQNSSSAIEALVLKKPVFRAGKYKPSTFEDYDELPTLDLLTKYLLDGESIEYIVKKNQIQNSNLIKNTIGFNDGLNHIRFVKTILNNLKNKKPKSLVFNTALIKYSLISIILNILKLLKISFNFEFNKRFVRNNHSKLSQNLKKSNKRLLFFYKNKISEILKLITS